MPYPWDQELNGGPGARQPAPPGLATGPIGRPPVGVITPDPLPRPGTPMFLTSQQSGAPRPAMSPYSRPPRIGPAPGPANDLPGRYLGPPVREGGGTRETKPRTTPPEYLGPPTPPDRVTRPRGNLLYKRPPRLPPEEPPLQYGDEGWTPWDEAGGPGTGDQTASVDGDPTVLPPLGPRRKPNGGNLPRYPGENDMPPGQGQSALSEEQARRRFGRWPGMADPQAPPPPVAPGGMNFNPFTGEWS